MYKEFGISPMKGSKWISASKDKLPFGKGNIIAYFVNSFNLENIDDLNIYITANNRYKLWVNGERVCTGPCKGDKWRHYYDTVNLKSYLKTGENIIAAQVLYYSPMFGYGEMKTPHNTVTNMYGPMLAVKGSCIDQYGNLSACITTGESFWKCYVDNAVQWLEYNEESYYFVADPFEKANGKNMPYMWYLNSSESSTWDKAVNITETDYCAWGHIPILPLSERPIPMLYENKRYFSSIRRDCSIGKGYEKINTGNYNETLTLPKNSKFILQLDAGELVTAYFQMHVIGGSEGKIKITYAEGYTKYNEKGIRIKGNREYSDEMGIYGACDLYYPSGKDEVYEPYCFRTFRFVELVIETSDDEMILFIPVYIETGYPLEIKSEFKAVPEWTNYLWDTSIRTLKRCMHDTYEDCPYYEQLQYNMDIWLQCNFTFMVSGDTRLALKAIDDLHSSMTPYGLLQGRAPTDTPAMLPVFNFYWILMLNDYYWQTGDISPIRRYSSSIDAILGWFERHTGKYGLVENLYYWEFIDWVDDWNGEGGISDAIPPAAKKGPSTIINIIYAYALKKAADLLRLIDRPDSSEIYEKRSQGVFSIIEKLCWSEEIGMYREGPGIEQYSQHAQALAVMSGLTEGQRAKTVMENCMAAPDIARCTFAFMFFLFRGMEKAGLYSKTERLWNFYKNCKVLGLTTWPEDFDCQRSDCHAWGSVPLYDFTRCILGVQPESPGWDKILIKPICDYLDNAEGSVITRHGSVKIEWHNIKGNWSIKGEVPEGIPFRVELLDGKVYEGIGGSFTLI